MVILCYLLTKEGRNIDYIRRMYKYYKDYQLFELEQQHLVCQIRSVFRTGKLPKVEVEGPMRKIKKLYVKNVKSETGELDAAEKKVMTRPDDLE